MLNEPFPARATLSDSPPVDDSDDERVRVESAVSRLQAFIATLPVLDDRTGDEILGYDEHGLPT